MQSIHVAFQTKAGSDRKKKHIDMVSRSSLPATLAPYNNRFAIWSISVSEPQIYAIHIKQDKK